MPQSFEFRSGKPQAIFFAPLPKTKPIAFVCWRRSELVHRGRTRRPWNIVIRVSILEALFAVEFRLVRCSLFVLLQMCLHTDQNLALVDREDFLQLPPLLPLGETKTVGKIAFNFL